MGGDAIIRVVGVADGGLGDRLRLRLMRFPRCVRICALKLCLLSFLREVSFLHSHLLPLGAAGGAIEKLLNI